jgi:hypothetical protein
MSNLWINWRFWYWHLQIGPDAPCVSISFNRYWWQRGISWHWFDFH